ncbi:hypothetical protein DFJ63DRAFT_310288 [Scheffersomyces coipomensis]|uniref:uncharacterized protein n=1 Tax=Scheffersomyces coipomensis TaxID=1788519 RepID=UPI00315D5336
MMDRKTFQHLSSRLDLLEILSGDINSDSDKSLQDQIVDLERKTGSVYGQNAEFQSLFTMLKELGLLNKPANKTNEQSETVIDEIDSESKKAEIVLHYAVVNEAYNNLNQLSTMNIPKLINYISQSQEKTHNFNQDPLKIMERQKELESISQTFHNLVMKNVIVFEKYIRLIAEENEFWLETEAKLKILQASIKNKENKKQEMSKY